MLSNFNTFYCIAFCQQPVGSTRHRTVSQSADLAEELDQL